jgi:hypothetical protein
MKFNFLEKYNNMNLEDAFSMIFCDSIGSINDMLTLHLENYGAPPTMTDDSFRSCVNIFIAGMSNQIVSLQDEYNMDDEARKAMAVSCGDEIVSIIKKYTTIKYDIDESSFNRNTNSPTVSKPGMEGKEI